MFGGGGSDIAIGGLGGDSFTAGLGNDEMHFLRVADSRAGIALRDVFMDFSSARHKLVFTMIDAMSSAAGNQDLTFIGENAFSGEGQIRVVRSGPNTIVEVNVQGAAGAEMGILLFNLNPATLDASNFGL